jgi:hypothetical protein
MLLRVRHWFGFAGLSCLALVAGGTGFTGAKFSGASANSGNVFTGATDWQAPSVTSAVISPTSGGSPVGLPGFLHQGGTYRVYANVSDANSGIASVSADLRAQSGSSAGAVTMSASSNTVGGVAYNYASAQQTASASLTAGAASFSISTADNASNSGSASFSVTVDNTAPTAVDIGSANVAGGTAGHPELGDTITYTFSEPVAPTSVLAGWSGASTPVVARFTNGSPADNLTIWNAANTGQLPLGVVTSGKKYVTATVSFGASGTPSAIVLSGNTLTLTLGTASGATATVNQPTSLSWTPAAGVLDRAANSITTAAVSQSTGSGVNF